MFKTLLRSASAATRQCKKNYGCTPVVVSDPDVKITVLSNGIRVATEQTGSSVACISLFAEAGPRYEVSCNNGISHLIEHLALKGFHTIGRQDLEAQLLQMGTKMTSKTTREIQYFSARTLPEYTANTINILARIMTDLDVNDDSIEEAKYNMCLEMVDADNDPKAVVFDYLHQTAFQGTNLALGVIGPTRNIQSFNSDFCYQFMRDHYQPYKLCIAASGAVIHDEILQYTQNCMGQLMSQPICVSEQGPRRYTGSEVRYRDDSMPHVHVAIAVEVPGYASPDFLPLMVARDIVGSWDRSQGRDLRNDSPVARAAATSHLCERYEAFYLPYRDIGLWGVYFVSEPCSIEDMVYNVQKNWMYLCTMLQQGDLERGLNATKLNILRSQAGVVNSCRDLGMQVMYTCNRKSASDLLYALDGVKTSTIRNVSDKYIYDRCPAVAAVGPTEALPDYTRLRAGMYWVRF